ncbi:potassium-transporting ATPase subunit KdpA [Leucobacter coleopterorum]|uniref:Potassium-transporting ATPase potassium-binding subunit n=1 Tax=Leucobacter coleopterorum TaxID=2714933 RepID=A0ABX6JV93_9MICO|nr:potassium-transporting ATPase subunit KdpA [Leucobacter coleopterorum]QIM17498.1 potassium-transporting ATPase subunit KdpA [Leucobacter coleopterorum]
MSSWVLAVVSFLTVALILGVLYRPLGDYMAWVFTSDKHWRVERVIYKLAGVDPERQQSWRGYLKSIVVFSIVGFGLLYLILRLQPWLPYSLGLPPMSPDLAFNTAVSFVGNTNWQSYSPEQTLGYVAQMAGLAVQNFVSAAVSMAVAIAVIRGLASRGGRSGLGNFWVDMVRANLRILLPISILAAVLLLAGGVIQNFAGFTDVHTIAGMTQTIPGGPVASQEAIKMLGTNGGGFFNANSAHPFENPTPWTNILQTLLLLLIPFTMPRTFGTMVGNQRAGYALLLTMAVLFILVYAPLTAFEFAGSGSAPELAGGAMEGKEQRFGIVGSTLFATATTGTTGGAVNSMHGSYTAFGGLMLMFDMMLGEVAPGGAGSGIYTLLILMVIAVFLTALLLGRAPVYLGKRLGVRELKIVSIAILVMPTLAIGGIAVSFAIPPVKAEIIASMGNEGSHGLSEVIYAFTSAAINNGSAFAGLSANTPLLNIMLGVIIMLGRFIPIALVLALAGSLATQGKAESTLELPLHRPQFVGLLVSLIVFIAVPMFVPMLLAGPLAEGFAP